MWEGARVTYEKSGAERVRKKRSVLDGLKGFFGVHPRTHVPTHPCTHCASDFGK